MPGHGPVGPQPGHPSALPDPTDPAVRDETIAHLRDLISQRRQAEPVGHEQPAGEGEPEQPREQRQKKAPDAPHTHEEWVERGREIALRQLGFSARSSQQLHEAMTSREVPEGAADEVIERLTRVGLIDDAEYAAMLVRTRQAERGLARRALRVELARKGIDQETAQEALEQVDENDEAHAARLLVRKRVSSMHNLDATKRRNRLYGTLARKGYSASAARAAIDEVLLEEGLELY